MNFGNPQQAGSARGPQEDGVGKPGVLKLVKLLDVDLAGEALELSLCAFSPGIVLAQQIWGP